MTRLNDVAILHPYVLLSVWPSIQLSVCLPVFLSCPSAPCVFQLLPSGFPLFSTCLFPSHAASRQTSKIVGNLTQQQARQARHEFFFTFSDRLYSAILRQHRHHPQQSTTRTIMGLA